MSFSNWREWKIWQWVGMAAFGILLAFLYSTNRKAYDSMKEEIGDKFNKKEDNLDQEKKNTEIKEVAKNVSDLKQAEEKLQKIAVAYDDKLKDESGKGGTTDEKVDDFNNFMGRR